MHNKIKYSIAIFTLFLTGFLTPTVWAAGFDCKKAGTAVEKMICADDELSILDSKLNDVFNEAQSEHTGIDGETGKRIDPVGNDQKKWLNSVRNACKNQSCLKKAYKAKISELQKNWLSQ